MKQHLAITLTLLLIAGAAVAAGLDGSWRLIFDTEAGERVGIMDLKANGSEVTGKFRAEEATDGIEVQGTFSDGELSFSFPFYSPDAGYEADLSLKAKVDGSKLTGSWEFDGHTGSLTGAKQ